jgi:two-component system, chemotaxis family, sensor kinase CheA
MDEFIGEFVADTRDGFDHIRNDLALWALDPHNRAALDAVFRFVHTVRGNCGFLKFARFEHLCVPAEAVLADIRSGKRAADNNLVAALICVIERIGMLADAIEAGTGLSAADEHDMIAALGVDVPARSLVAPGLHRLAARERTIRLSAVQFDTLVATIEELEAAHRTLLDMVAHAALPAHFNPALSRLCSAIATTGDALTRSRKQALDSLVPGLDRLAAQAAEVLGKSIRLETHGTHILLDREWIDALRDSFVHIIRNAIDHGIEPMEERVLAAKETCGIITLSAFEADGGVTIIVEDDGRGVDLTQMGAADDNALLTLLAKPGFSTAADSVVSGRGVGLDAVRRRIEELGGRVAIRSRQGQGMQILMSFGRAQMVRDAA